MDPTKSLLIHEIALVIFLSIVCLCKTKGHSKISMEVEVPELSHFTRVFHSCHIHLINYRKINFDQSKFTSPISISYFTFHKILRNPNLSKTAFYFKLKYEGIKERKDTTRVKANFRWDCNLHVFLLPEDNEIETHEQFPQDLVNRWNGEGQIQRENFKLANHKVFRFDYFFLFTTSTSSEIYGKWAQNLEYATFIENNGYFHRAIVVLQDQDSESTFLDSQASQIQNSIVTFKIIDLFVICPFCSPETYEYVKLDLLLFIGSFTTFNALFNKALSTHHHENPIGITDIKYVGKLFQTEIFESPSFRGISSMDKVDMIYLSILYSNRSYTRVFVPQLRIHSLPSPTLPWITIRVTGSSVMNILQSSYSFITCDGFRGFSRPPFLLFVSAFQPTTWIALVCCGILLALALKVVSKLQKVEVKASFIPLQALLEQDVCMESRKMAGFSWLVGTWMIICVILTNAYKGQTITDLTAPHKPLLYETFDQLLGNREFKFFSKRKRIFVFPTQSFVNYPDPSRNEFLYELFTYQDYISPDASIYQNDPRHIWNSPEFYQEKTKMNKILNQTQSVLHNGTYDALLEAVLDCNKTALLEEVRVIEQYEVILRRLRPQKFVARGKELVLKTSQGWKISTAKDPLLNWRLECFLQSGINLVWQTYLKFLGEIKKNSVEDSFKEDYEGNNGTVASISYGGDATEEETKPLSLGGNLRLVFYTYVLAVIWSIVVYLGECSLYVFAMCQLNLTQN